MTDSERRAQAAENYAELSSRIDSELSVGWTLKASVESRALGLFALNLGVVTLFLAISDGLELKAPAATSPFYWVLWGAFGASALSLVLSLVATWPVNYKALSANLLSKSYANSKRADTLLLPDLIPYRLQALKRLRKVNTSKARWVVASMIFAAVSVGCLVAIVVSAVLFS